MSSVSVVDRKTTLSSLWLKLTFYRRAGAWQTIIKVKDGCYTKIFPSLYVDSCTCILNRIDVDETEWSLID